jgi:tetratricopeptide (TPR) repeat protein
MQSLIAGLSLPQLGAGARFTTYDGHVSYGGVQTTSLMHGEPPRGLAGEDVKAVLLEVREDGAWLVTFPILWADEGRGPWAAVVRPGEAPTPPRSLVRIGEPGAASVSSPNDPLLERARHLATAFRAWERRSSASTRRAAAGLALPALEAAAAQLPDVPWVHAMLGMTLLWMDRAADALGALEHARSAGEDFPCERGRALLALGRAEEACDALAGVEGRRGLRVRGQALAALRRHEDALLDLRRAVEEGPRWDEVDAHGAWRLVLWEDDLREAAELALAETLRGLGRFQEALEALTSRGEEATLLRGACFEGLEQWSDAKAQYTLAQEAGSSRARDHLARVNAASALRLARPAAAPAEGVDIDIDSIVEHPTLGRGRVIDVEEGRVPFLVIAFEGAGEKRLAARLVRVVEG